MKSQYYCHLNRIFRCTGFNPEVSPGSAIFFSVLAIGIADYSLSPKTLNLTLPELTRNPGVILAFDALSFARGQK
jgi:hypothetical protein